MKTLLFTLEYPPFKGGVSKYYENIVKYWPEKRGIFVLHNNENKLFKNKIFPFWIFSIFPLLKEIKKHKIEHVIVGNLLPLGTVVYFLSKIKKIKYSVILHGTDINYAGKKFRKKIITTKILKKSETIICGNSYVADFVRVNFDKMLDPKIKVVNPGIETEINIDYTKTEELKIKYKIYNNPLIFSIGRLIKRKGFDSMIDAMSEIHKYSPEAFYVIAGEGPDREYLKDKAEGIPNIIFLGEISEAEKWLWLSMCDLFAMPARNEDGDIEGFGIVYLEAALCGKPVLAGDIGGVRDAVIPAVSGFLTDSKNIEKIANYAIKIISEKEEGKKMGKFARKRVLENFQASDQSKKIYNLINS